MCILAVFIVSSVLLISLGTIGIGASYWYER